MPNGFTNLPTCNNDRDGLAMVAAEPPTAAFPSSIAPAHRIYFCNSGPPARWESATVNSEGNIIAVGTNSIIDGGDAAVGTLALASSTTVATECTDLLAYKSNDRTQLLPDIIRPVATDAADNLLICGTHDPDPQTHRYYWTGLFGEDQRWYSEVLSTPRADGVGNNISVSFRNDTGRPVQFLIEGNFSSAPTGPKKGLECTVGDITLTLPFQSSGSFNIGPLTVPYFTTYGCISDSVASATLYRYQS